MAYFVTLLRYIHQNPTKAGIVSKVGIMTGERRRNAPAVEIDCRDVRGD